MFVCYSTYEAAAARWLALTDSKEEAWIKQHFDGCTSAWSYFKVTVPHLSGSCVCELLSAFKTIGMTRPSMHLLCWKDKSSDFFPHLNSTIGLDPNYRQAKHLTFAFMMLLVTVFVLWDTSNQSNHGFSLGFYLWTPHLRFNKINRHGGQRDAYGTKVRHCECVKRGALPFWFVSGWMRSNIMRRFGYWWGRKADYLWFKRCEEPNYYVVCVQPWLELGCFSNILNDMSIDGGVCLSIYRHLYATSQAQIGRGHIYDRTSSRRK